MGYAGPLRDEPIAIELHNTIYATSAGIVDALADAETVCAWLDAMAPRLGLDGAPVGAWPEVAELRALRGAVRAALQAAVPIAHDPARAAGAEDRAEPGGGVKDRAEPGAGVSTGAEGRGTSASAAGERAALDAINRASGRAPRSPSADWRPGEPPARGTDFHGATRAQVVLAALAADAIELLTSPHRDQLRTCGAPGCVLMFLKEHPRREWCSDGCGNRARQARHYERTRRAGPR